MNLASNPIIQKLGLANAVDNLSPTAQKTVAYGSIGAVALAGIALMVSMDDTKPKAVKDTTVKNSILSEIDTRSIGIEALSAQVQRLENEIGTRNHKIRDLESQLLEINKRRGNDPSVTQNIEVLKNNITALTERASELGWDVQDIKQNLADPEKNPLVPKEQRPFKFPEAPAAGIPTPPPAPATPPASPNPFESAPVANAFEGAPSPTPSGTANDAKAKAAPLVIRTIESKPAAADTADTVEPVYLPAGSMISGVLINGIDSPTGQGARENPHPALVSIDAAAILPNQFSADIAGCTVLMSGYGDLSSERTFMRAEVAACQTKDGKTIEAKLAGYAIGEDGKAGLRSRLVHRAGSLLAKTAMAGFASGVAEAFGGSPVPVIQTSSTNGSTPYQRPNTSDAMNYGIGKGGSEALSKLADYYMSMAESIFPVLETDAMRRVDIVLTSGFTMKVSRKDG